MKPKCPKCQSRMEWKDSWGEGESGQGGYSLWQCPACKNIEVFSNYELPGGQP